MQFKHTVIPKDGMIIEFDASGKMVVPNNPVVAFIEGDGIGPDIWKASKFVIDSAVKKAYGGKKEIKWAEIYAGEKCFDKTGEWIVDETYDAIRYCKVAIKGPLTTPVGGGIRSLNVTLRQVLDLYACVRPVRYFKGVGAPVKTPEKVNMVIFRENTEDVYAGYEWDKSSEEAKKLRRFLKTELNVDISDDSGIGIKPISVTATRRLMKMAIEYAIKNKRKSITIMHKGNIMKFTEGAFKKWCYDEAVENFRSVIVTEDELWQNYDGKLPANKILVKDRIADAMFQQILLRPDEYEVIITPNLNGDYISDALAAEVGGLGMAPGANIGDREALFEATHGTAPKYANLDKVNPGSLILSGVMMLEHLGWTEAAELVYKGMERAIESKNVTYDLARQMDNPNEVKASQFAAKIVDFM